MTKAEPPEEYERARLEIERERLQIEKSRLETQTAIEEAKLSIEKLKVEHDIEQIKAKRKEGWWQKDIGIIIAAFIGALAAILTAVVSYNLGQSNLELTSAQKKLEIELLDKQKEKELTLLEVQKKREWDLDAAKFVSDNRKAIFDGTPQEQQLFAKLISVIYPAEVSTSLLERLAETAVTPAAKDTWHEARKRVLQSTNTKPVDAGSPGTQQPANEMSTINATRGRIADGEVQSETNDALYLNVRPCAASPLIVVFHKPYSKTQEGEINCRDNLNKKYISFRVEQN